MPGKPRGALVQPLCDDYAARCRRMGTPFEFVFVREQKEGAGSAAADLSREASALCQHVPANHRLVALTERGTALDSAAFAATLTRLCPSRDAGVAFVLGSARGLCPDLLARADARIALSPLTLPHDLALLVLCEQLYRALTIHAGLPYHR